MKPNKFPFGVLPEDGIGSDALHRVSSWCPNEEITPRKFGNGQLSLDLIVIVMRALQFCCALLCGGLLAAESLDVCGCLQWCQSLLSCFVWAFDLKYAPVTVTCHFSIGATSKAWILHVDYQPAPCTVTVCP